MLPTLKILYFTGKPVGLVRNFGESVTFVSLLNKKIQQDGKIYCNSNTPTRELSSYLIMVPRNTHPILVCYLNDLRG